MEAGRAGVFRAWPVFALMLLGTALSVSVWSILDTSRSDRISALLQAEARHQASILGRELQLRVLSMAQLASSWSKTGGMSREVFQADAMRHIEALPGLRAVGFTTPEGLVIRVAPEATSKALGRNIVEFSPDRRRAMEKAGQIGEPVMTNLIDLVDGSGKGLIVFVPSMKDGAPVGFINTVFNVQSWIESSDFYHDAAEARNTYYQSLTVNGELAFQDGVPGAKDLARTQAETISLFGNDLTIEVWPSAGFLSTQRGMVPELAALIVLISLGASVTCLYLANRAMHAKHLLHKTNERLMLNVKQLNAEMSERRQAEAQARVARETTSRFLTTMSHEIRTPLNAIMGMFQLISKADVPERQKRQAAGGMLASQRLFRELTNVLDVSRLDAGAMSIQPRIVKTESLLEDWQNVLEGLVQKSEKPLKISVVKGENLPETVRLDHVRLSQIVTNLLDNAVKFTETGEIRLQMQTDGPDLTLEVVDSGPGIQPDDVEAVFQRFYQVHDGMSRSYDGSGLGLLISRDLAALMQGTLTVENGATRGSIFTLRLINVVGRDHAKPILREIENNGGPTPAKNSEGV